MVDNPNWKVRANIALAMGHFLHSKPAQSVLEQLCHDDDHRVRLFVVNSLCDSNNKTAIRLLATLVKDKNSEISLKATNALKLVEFE